MAKEPSALVIYGSPEEEIFIINQNKVRNTSFSLSLCFDERLPLTLDGNDHPSTYQPGNRNDCKLQITTTLPEATQQSDKSLIFMIFRFRTFQHFLVFVLTLHTPPPPSIASYRHLLHIITAIGGPLTTLFVDDHPTHCGAV